MRARRSERKALVGVTTNKVPVGVEPTGTFIGGWVLSLGRLGERSLHHGDAGGQNRAGDGVLGFEKPKGLTL